MSKPPNEIFPQLPEQFASLIKGLKQPKKEKAVCNCTGVELPIEKCPCLNQSPELKEFYNTLPYRIQLIDRSKNKDEIKEDLFELIMKLLEKCQLDTSVETHTSVQLTHLHHYLAHEFGIPIDEFIENNHLIMSYEFGNQKSTKLARIIPKLSVSVNVLLTFLKIFAYFFSKSLSVLTSLADSAMDVLSGAVLLVATRLAENGFPKGEFQDLPRKSNEYKFIYANRFESLGVIAFSAINSALCASLLISSIENIVDISKGRAGEVSFELLPMCIMIFTITVKIILWIMTQMAMKRSKNATVLKSFRDDHKNDTFSNIFSFIGVMLASRNEKLAYFDPCVSAAFLCYVCFNWGSNCINEMKQLAGEEISKEELNDIYIRLLAMYPEIELIDEVISIVGYNEGSNIVLEITVNMKNNLSLEEVNNCIIKIEKDFESCDGIERCYVNCENDVQPEEAVESEEQNDIIENQEKQTEKIQVANEEQEQQPSDQANPENTKQEETK